MTEKEIGIVYARLVEIATLLKDGLIEDDYDSAMEYMADTIELTEKEAEFLGIDYEDMKKYSRYYEEEDGDWDALEDEIITGKHPFLEPWDI